MKKKPIKKKKKTVTVIKTDGKPKVGRPCEYTKEIGKKICERIASGESLNKICEDEMMPNKSTVISWALHNKDSENKELKEFSNQYARAREVQSEVLIDTLFDTVKDKTGDMTIDPSGKITVDYENIARSRLIADTIKWYASKMRPRIYGDKLQIGNPEGESLEIKWVIGDNTIQTPKTTS